GTAGWMSALMLVSFLNRTTQNPIKITLIESANIPTVGVGEATVPGMVGLMKTLGVDEFEFFRRCNASFKCGVRFVDWNKRPDGSSQTFVHPFQTAPYLDHFRSAYHFHRFATADDDFAGSVIANQEMVDAGKGPRPLTAQRYETTFNYAYHLDAGLFANFMRDLAVERGVEHIYDDIEKVELDESGKVAALQLKQGGRRPVEFVIDCTGFRGLIVNEALKEPFTSFNDMLLCDRALAVQVDHLCEDEIESCTTSTALGAGWVWNVPLYNRVGTGYVFSSQFRSDDEATAEFLEHLGPRAEGKEPRVVPMRVGRSERCWVGNCLAVGLSSGFIEPLESTAIYIIEMQMRWFLESFPDKSVNPLLAKRYNR
ncbi:MAG: tryptophan halogenase family protein, partial [Rhodovibrionaceae bacterium]